MEGSLASILAPGNWAWFNIVHPVVTLLGHRVGGTGKLVCPWGLGWGATSEAAPPMGRWDQKWSRSGREKV